MPWTVSVSGYRRPNWQRPGASFVAQRGHLGLYPHMENPGPYDAGAASVCQDDPGPYPLPVSAQQMERSRGSL